MDLRKAQLTDTGEPYLVILEEPQQHGQRFRYKCEGRSAGSIQGANSTPERKTVPTIQIKNYNGPGAIIVVSCVSKDSPFTPHPHSLVGTDCKDGVCTIRLRSGQTTVQLSNVGIQCCRRQDVARNLELRQKLRVNPFGTNYPQNDIDLGVVRLCFQTFLPDSNKRFTRILPPVVTAQIFDKKTVRELVICRLSATCGSVQGGEEVFLLCEKVNKDDIQVRFFEENEDGIAWEGYGEFTPQDVHRQVAIVFKTPAYRDQNITAPVTTYIQLRRQSDDEVGDPKPFIFRPKDPDPDGIEFKKRKLNGRATINFLHDNLPLTVLQHIKDEPELEFGQKFTATNSHQTRLIKKPNRTGGMASAAAAAAVPGSVSLLETITLPQYTYTNLGTDSTARNLFTIEAIDSQPTVLNLLQDPLLSNVSDVQIDVTKPTAAQSFSFDSVLASLVEGGGSGGVSSELSLMSQEELLQLMVDYGSSSEVQQSSHLS